MRLCRVLCALVFAMLLVSSARAASASPGIADWSTLKITLRRGGCECEAYKVEISGDGTVEYDGYDIVAVRGPHRFRIPESAVRDLAAAFRRANFFDVPEDNLRREPGVVYAIPLDAFNTYIKISFDGRSKEVTDYSGSGNLVFENVRALETMIDDAAGMPSWVEGDAMTLAKLGQEGWDFRIPADKHSMLLFTAAEVGNSALVSQLLDTGVAARNTFGCAALRTAADRDDLKTAALLVDAQVPTNAPEFDQPDRYLPRCAPLNAAAGRGDPRMIELILRLHPNVDRRDFRDKTPLIEAVENASGIDEENRREWEAVIDLLLAAEADPYLKDQDGKTALDRADSKDGIRPILERWMAEHPQK